MNCKRLPDSHVSYLICQAEISDDKHDIPFSQDLWVFSDGKTPQVTTKLVFGTDPLPSSKQNAESVKKQIADISQQIADLTTAKATNPADGVDYDSKQKILVDQLTHLKGELKTIDSAGRAEQIVNP